MIIVMKARTLMMSEFFSVFSMMDLNVLGAKSNGKPTTKIKNAVRSRSSCGKSNMRNYGKKIKLQWQYAMLEFHKRSPENECGYEKYQYSHDPCPGRRTIDPLCIPFRKFRKSHHAYSFEHGKVSQ